MARQDNEPNKDLMFDAVVPVETAKRIQRMAALQRSSMHKLQHQGIKLSHLMSIVNVATGSLATIKHGGPANRHVVNDGEGWKDGDKQPHKYDGGADAALDSLIAGAAMRMLKIVEDDTEWDKSVVDLLENNLREWSEWEKISASMTAATEKASRRPSVLHTVEIFNGPRGLWYAVMAPFTQELKKATPVIGVGTNPADAAEDFDRAFTSGELNPAALLFLEEAREAEEAENKKRAQRRSKGSK